MDQDEIPTETRLHSEIAALKYKNERLTQELRDCECRLKSKETSALHQNNEIESLKESQARLNAINISFQKKLQDSEERERSSSMSNQRYESDLTRCKQENQHFQDRIVELESQLRSIMIDREASDQAKDSAQRSIIEFCRKISSAIDFHEDQPKAEPLLKRIYEIYQENTRFKLKIVSLKQTIESLENETKANSDALSRLSSDKEHTNQQIVSYLTSLDQLKREKDQLITDKSYLNTELQSFRERTSLGERTVLSLTEQTKSLEQQLITFKENCMSAEERANRYEKDLKNFQESVAIQLSTGSRMVEAAPIGIRERIKDVQIELKEKQFSNDQLREKVGRMTETIERLEKILSEIKGKQEDAISEKVILGKRLQEAEAQLTTMEILNEGLRKDKNRFMQFLEQLGNSMGLDEVSRELGFDLQTDAVLARAEQLSKLEGDRLADKTATVYQLQRRIRTLKEQVEKKDLHLDMLRRKITILEDSVKLRTSLELERDEAIARSKQLLKHVDRLELDLRDARVNVKDLKSQMTDAAEYKIISLERARKIEEAEKKLNDLELLRVKYNRKVNLLKDQLKISRDNMTQERDLNDHAFQQLSQELTTARKNLVDCTRREAQLLNLRNTIGKILGMDWSKTIVPDYELIAKLEKIVQTNREFAHVSRKLSDSIKMIPQPNCSPRESESQEDYPQHQEITRRNV